MTLCLSPVASGDQRSAFDVRFGSEADILAGIGDVRFTPESGHFQNLLRCPLSAKSGHRIISGEGPSAQ
jgi:hypothetical protein